MNFHYVPARDCPDATDARTEARNEREARLAQRDPDNYKSQRGFRQPVQQEGEVRNG